MNILVTGGAGFIGSRLTQGLLDYGHKVVVADNLSTGKRSNLPIGCEFIEMDLGKPEQYSRFNPFPIDAICHLAGQSSGEASFLNPEKDFESHVVSTFYLLQLCKEKNICRFLYASSMAVYGDPKALPVDENQPPDPKTIYAAGKLAAEGYLRLAQHLGVNVTIFRLFSVYGPRQDLSNKMQGMVSIYLSYLLENQPVVVKGSKDRFRDFVFVDDVVEAFRLSLEEPKTFGKTYNVGSGLKTTVGELLQQEFECLKKTDHPVSYAENTPGDQFGVYADILKIQRELGWRPKWNLRQGLEKMIQSYAMTK